MPQYAYPPSSFENFVGNALGGYSMAKGFQRDAADERRRREEARQRNALFKMNLDREGYQEVDFTVPKVEPRRNFLQSLGRTLLGAPEQERDVRLLKMGPSVAERLAAEAQRRRDAEREDSQGHALEVARFNVQSQAERDAAERAFTAQQNALNRSNSRAITGMQMVASQRSDARLRDEASERRLDDAAERAIEAAGGDARRAVEILTSDPTTRDVFTQGMGMGRLQAAASRFAERRRVNDANEGRAIASYQDRQDRQRRKDFRARLDGGAQAGGNGQTSGIAEQQAAWDRAAAALRAEGKEPESVIGPKPGSSAQLPPLTDAQRQRAQSDPEYRQFLTEKGYSLPRDRGGIKTVTPAEYRALREQGYQDTDVWEALVAAGVPPSDATARVNALRAGR